MQTSVNPTSSHRIATIIDHVRVARDTYRMRLAAPEIAREVLPGQFVMVRPETGTDPLLGRAFALYEVIRDSNDQALALDVVYLVMGKGTGALSRLHVHDRVSVWGPLGNGFGPLDCSAKSDVWMIAGGVGQTPFVALARWWQGLAGYGSVGFLEPIDSSSRIRLFYGVRSQDLLAGVEDFQAAGVQIEIATNDGSIGHQGYVTDLVRHRLEQGERPSKIVACGPAPMLAIAARLANDYKIPCEVSLENHMACGFGACFSCVAPILDDENKIDLRRVCVDGPVFPADRVVWN